MDGTLNETVLAEVIRRMVEAAQPVPRVASWSGAIGSLALACAVAACDPPRNTGQSAAVTIRDSTGIEIVENHAPRWDGGTAWRVDRTPAIAIGGHRDESEADSSHLVWNIGDVRALSDGRVAMISRGERRVLVFEPSGAFARTIGRVGRGPGEYGNPEHLQVLPGDTLVVWDFMAGPVAYFDPSGKLLRDWRIDVGALFEATRNPNQMSPERVHLPLAGRSFIVQAILVPGDFIPPFGEPYRVPVEFLMIDSTYAARSLGRWEEGERLYLQPPGPPRLPFPFGVQLAAGGTPLSVYITNADQYEIHQYSASGKLRRILRRAADPIPVTANDIEQWKAWYGRSRDWSSWDRAMTELPPRTRPPVAGLLVDSRGYLWVMDRDRLDRSASEWSVYDPAGHWLGTMEIPLGRVEWIGEDLILGVSQDPETGVQVVEGYRLHTGSEPPS